MQQFERREIGQRIARARNEANGMTQEALAEVLGVTIRQLQKYESGETIPWKHFQTLEGVFRRPLRWFLHGDEEPVEGFAEVVERLERIEQRLLQLAAQSDQDAQAAHQ